MTPPKKKFQIFNDLLTLKFEKAKKSLKIWNFISTLKNDPHIEMSFKYDFQCL